MTTERQYGWTDDYRRQHVTRVALADSQQIVKVGVPYPLAQIAERRLGLRTIMVLSDDPDNQPSVGDRID